MSQEASLVSGLLPLVTVLSSLVTLHSSLVTARLLLIVCRSPAYNAYSLKLSSWIGGVAAASDDEVVDLKAPLLTKEGCRRIADGVVLYAKGKQNSPRRLRHPRPRT